MGAQVGARSAGSDPTGLDSATPGQGSDRQRDPGRSVHLDDVGRRAAGVPDPGKPLDGRIGRHPNLDGFARVLLPEELQGRAYQILDQRSVDDLVARFVDGPVAGSVDRQRSQSGQRRRGLRLGYRAPGHGGPG